MASTYQGRIKRDDIHKSAHSQLATEQPPADRGTGERDGWIDEQLSRVIARLPVNVDGALVVGGAFFICPPVVAEPAVSRCNKHEIAAPLVREPLGLDRFAMEDSIDSRISVKEICDSAGLRRIREIHVSNLVIGYGEGGACASVE